MGKTIVSCIEDTQGVSIKGGTEYPGHDAIGSDIGEVAGIGKKGVSVMKNIEDALKRANAYSKAGADAILIHSKENTPKQIFDFSKKFRNSKYFKPLVAVPSTYSNTSEKELVKHGFKIVIYANHFLRALHPAIVDVAKMILKNQRSFEAEKKMSSINEIINLI